MFKRLLITISFSFLFILSYAQNAKFEYFGNGSGISNNRIWGMTQDPQGFLWVYTDGVNRFDGHDFLNYHDLEIPFFKPQQNVQTLNVEDDNLLYIYSESLIFFNTQTEEETSIDLSAFLENDEQIIPGLISKSNSGIFAIPYFDKSNKSVGFFSYQKGEVENLGLVEDAFADFNINYIRYCIDDKENIYFLSRDFSNIVKFDSKTKEQTKIPANLDKSWFFIKTGRRNEILMSSDQKMFILRSDEKGFIEHPVNTKLPQENFLIHDFLETEEGDLWITGSSRTLFFYDISSDEIYNYESNIAEIIPNQVDLRKIFEDENGVLWIQTVLGLIKVSPHTKLFDTYVTDPQEICRGYCSFRGLTEDEQGMIYASFYSSIAQINLESKEVTFPFSGLSYSPFDLEYNNGYLYLNNGNQLNLTTKESQRLIDNSRLFADIGVFTKDGKGRFWLAFKNVVYTLVGENEASHWDKVYEFSDPQTNISDILYESATEQLFIGTVNELVTYDPVSHEVKPVEIDNGEKLNLRVRKLYIDQNGGLWVGTDFGLISYEPESKAVKKYTTEDGLSHDFVCGILPEGDSCLWLATNFGLSRMSIENETFINFYEEEGLPHNEFNRRSSFKSKSGKMFFGGIQGLIAFYPEEVMAQYKAINAESRVVLSNYSKNDLQKDTFLQSYFHGEEPSIDLYHFNNPISFEYTLSDLRTPEKIQYSYKLEGYDPVWSKASKQRTTHYNNLPAGEYTFKVRATDGKGNWKAKPLHVHLIVHPPWWKTWAAYLAYLLLFAAILYGVYFITKRRLKLKLQLGLKQEEAKKLKELDTFKSRLFTNLTHEFRTPLTVIQGMAEQIEKAPQKNLDKGLKSILRNSKNLLRLINQLLDLSKLESSSFKLNLQNGDIISYLNYLTGSFQSYANQQNLSLRFKAKVEELNMDYDPDQMQQVMTNLISNAIKFTPSGGEVKVLVSEQSNEDENNFLLIEVNDTGIGIPNADLQNVFNRFYQVDASSTRKNEGSGIGLAHANELVRLMKGELSVESELNKGTSFFIKLPINNEVIETAEFDAHQIKEPVMIQTGAFESELVTQETINANSDAPQLLIIEDNPDVVLYLKTCLEEHYNLDIAYNGRVGIEKAIKKIPDLIISDVMMPEKNGYEVCEFLKNDEKTSHIPIVLLTAKADLESKIEGLQQGADAYLSKPFNKEELLVRLEMLNALRKKLITKYSLSTSISSEVKNESVFPKEDAFLIKLNDILEANIQEEDFGLPQLCQKIRMSRSQLFRKLKALIDKAPSDYIRTYRLNKAKQLLETSDFNVAEAAYEVGFKDPSYFSKLFQKEFGMQPNATRK